MKYPIPEDAIDDRIGIIGTSGSGKTYSAGTAVEILLARHSRVVVVDPLGAWWGLRLDRDGKKASPFNVVIFGGAHADLPLTEQAGALIGESAASMAESCIIDLSKLPSRAAERRFMVAFLESIYRKAGGEPFHLVVDEADLFAPQRPQSGDEVLLGHMENIVRRGRMRGFIPWLISQRPAVLNKNVLSQVDGLIALRLTASQDRDALDAWIEGQADKEQGKAIKDALPTFKVGEGVVWLPAHGILEKRSFPLKTTFDSSGKPKRGETKRAHALKPLDVDNLKERMASLVEEAKANDPKQMRAEIRRLKDELAGLGIDQTVVQQAYERGLAEGSERVRSAFHDAIDRMKSRNESTARDFEAAWRTMSDVKARPAAATRQLRPAERAPNSDRAMNGDRPHPSTLPAVPKSEQKILDAIRWWNTLGVATPSHPQVGFMAGYSHKGGTWSTYLSRLRTSGLIENRGDLMLTENGRRVAAAPDRVPSGDQLRAMVLGKIDAPLRRILEPVLSAYPDGLTHEAAAKAALYSSSGGTWSTYLSRLRSLDLIEGRGELKAQSWLFPGG